MRVIPAVRLMRRGVVSGASGAAGGLGGKRGRWQCPRLAVVWGGGMGRGGDDAPSARQLPACGADGRWARPRAGGEAVSGAGGRFVTRRHQASGGRRRDVESYFCLIGHHETYLFKGCHTKYFHTVSQYSFIMVCVSFVVGSIQSFKNQFRLLHKVNNLKEELQKLSLCVTRKKYQNIQERYKFCRYNCSKT